jgi:hypothetical protein
VQRALATAPGAKLWPIDKLRNKWACTFHRFKEAHDKVKKSGRGATNFHYYDAMEKLFVHDARVERTVGFSSSHGTTPSGPMSETDVPPETLRASSAPPQASGQRILKRQRPHTDTDNGKPNQVMDVVCKVRERGIMHTRLLQLINVIPKILRIFSNILSDSSENSSSSSDSKSRSRSSRKQRYSSVASALKKSMKTLSKNFQKGK